MKSIWNKEIKINQRKPLDKDIRREVAVVGAGMTGLLTAYLLHQRGMKVVVIEANRIASGVTRNTTAKISVSYPNFYDSLIKNLGLSRAKVYSQSMEQAVENFHKIITGEQIDCNYEQHSSYIYASDDAKRLKKEWTATKRLGMNTDFVDLDDLPFQVTKALEFKNQAMFHPVKFLEFISRDLEIYERTPARKIQENRIITPKGEITARTIIVATHYPIQKFEGLYFSRTYQEGSRVTAFRNTQKLNGMYIGDEYGSYSLRNYKDFLIVGSVEGRYKNSLMERGYDEIGYDVRTWYPNAEEETRWSNQDCMTIDGLPFIGKLTRRADRIYTATGYGKWGMIGSMMAADLLKDLVLEKSNPLAEIVTPNRFSLKASYSKLAKHIGITTSNLTLRKLTVPVGKFDKIKEGYGGIVEYNGDKVGIYKEKGGKVYMLSTKCPHLGCQLEWNQDDLSWDCPCHGSRFDYRGYILNNPAAVRCRIMKINKSK